jgi:hypothetical protein
LGEADSIDDGVQTRCRAGGAAQDPAATATTNLTAMENLTTLTVDVS